MTKKKMPQTIEECNAEIEKLPVEWNSSSRSNKGMSLCLDEGRKCRIALK